MITRWARIVVALCILACLAEGGTLRAQNEPGEFLPPDQFYFSTGVTFMRRQRLRSAVVSVLDPGVSTTTRQTRLFNVMGHDGDPDGEETVAELTSISALIPGTVNVTTRTFPDTGTQPPAGSPTFGDFEQVHPKFGSGLRMTLGYRIGDGAVEVSGFFLSRRESQSQVASSQLPGVSETIDTPVLNQAAIRRAFDPENDGDARVDSVGSTTLNVTPSTNRLDLPFFNAPAGFRGTNGLWLQADRVLLRLENTLGNIEFNYRTAGGEAGLEGLALVQIYGVRYSDAKERFSLLTVDDVIATPTTTALYQVEAHNHIVAPQVGLELRDVLVPSVLTLSATAKAAWGLNELTRTALLRRGDGLVGFKGTHYHEGFAQVYELGAMAEFNFFDRVHLNAGYNALVMLGVAQAAEQVDYNLSHTSGRARNNGHLFYAGPSLELAFTF